MIFEHRTKGDEGKAIPPHQLLAITTFLIVLSEMEVKVVSLDF